MIPEQRVAPEQCYAPAPTKVRDLRDGHVIASQGLAMVLGHPKFNGRTGRYDVTVCAPGIGYAVTHPLDGELDVQVLVPVPMESAERLLVNELGAKLLDGRAA